MREALRGRNLAHVGCLLGLIIGLGGGIALAWALILRDMSILLAMLIWIALVAALGGIGYALGSAATDKERAV